MLCRITLITEIQSPFPAMIFSKLQDALKSRAKAWQEEQIVTSLELWQYKQLQVKEWREAFCKSLRAEHGMTLIDIRCERIEEAEG
jgi:hypothetical protein